MHHKRRRAKSRRAGCLYCKPWKDQRVRRRGTRSSRKPGNLENTTRGQARSWEDYHDQLREAGL